MYAKTISRLELFHEDVHDPSLDVYQRLDRDSAFGTVADVLVVYDDKPNV